MPRRRYFPRKKYLYVQFTQTSFRFTARAIWSGTRSAVLFNIVHTEIGFSAHRGSLSLYLISTLTSGYVEVKEFAGSTLSGPTLPSRLGLAVVLASLVEAQMACVWQYE